MSKADEVSNGFLARLPLAQDDQPRRYAIAIAGIVLAFGIRWMAAPYVGLALPFAAAFLSTILVTFIVGRGPGLLTGLGGALLANYFFVDMSEGFALDRLSLVSTGAYLLVSMVLVVCIDIAQRAKLRSERHAATSRLLFDELQHRVSNNLQVIGSLLSAQKRRVADDVARSAIEEAATRLTVVGQISRELYRPDGGQSDMGDFLKRVSDAVLGATGRHDVTCRLDIAPDVKLSPERAVPLALVFTEALSNALEHGLPDTGGTVTITLSRANADRIILCIDDDGRGLPEGFQIAQSESLGLQIATSLARQLDGEFTLEARPVGGGARARLDIAA